MKLGLQENSLRALLMLGCTISWLSVAQAESADDSSMKLGDMVDMVIQLGQNCEPKPERKHVEEMVLNKEDASHESKCFRRCMLKQFEIMPEGASQFEVAKALEMIAMMFPEDEAKSRAIIEKCNQAAQGNADPCEVVHNISMCMLHEMRAASYNIPEIKE